MFQQMVKTATERLQQGEETDFSASLDTQQSQRSGTANAHYLPHLGYLRLGGKDKAKEELTLALQAGLDHLGGQDGSGPRLTE